MKIVCIGVILCFCLALTLAWHDNYWAKQEDDKRKFIDRFLQFLAAPKFNGKCNDVLYFHLS